MGIGYEVSPLHRIAYLDTAAMERQQAAAPKSKKDAGEQYIIDLMTGFSGAGTGQKPKGIIGEPSFRYPAADAIAPWRDRLAAKYHGQLDEVLIWDESSGFEDGDDVATSADVMLRYVTALADEGGPAALTRLIGTGRPPQADLEQALSRAEQRGYTGRYPQLLLVEQYWLPFRRDMIIAEPDWEGQPSRFGSASNLLRQVTEVRALIRRADPKVVRWTADEDAPEHVLDAAWQASETVHRLATLAVAHHLPLWCAT
jgi:hypothetical protein